MYLNINGIPHIHGRDHICIILYDSLLINVHVCLFFVNGSFAIFRSVGWKYRSYIIIHIDDEVKLSDKMQNVCLCSVWLVESYPFCLVYSNQSRIRICIQKVKHLNEKEYFLANLFVWNAAIYLLSRSVIMQSATLNINLAWIFSIIILINWSTALYVCNAMQFTIHINFDNIGYLIYSTICSMFSDHSKNWKLLIWIDPTKFEQSKWKTNVAAIAYSQKQIRNKICGSKSKIPTPMEFSLSTYLFKWKCITATITGWHL